MSSLLYGFWKYLFKKDEFFVLIVGLDNAGKSTFLEQVKTKFCPNYKGMKLSKITTTVGLNIGKIECSGVTINFLDLGGQLELQPLWNNYYSETHGLIYLIDASDSTRFEESKTSFEQMIKHTHLQTIPLLFVANKQDIENSLTLAQIQEKFKLTKDGIGKREFFSINCSAINGTGIKEGIEWMVDCVKENAVNRPPSENDYTVYLLSSNCK